MSDKGSGTFVPTFGEALEFNAEDLEQNRQGEISSAQLDRIRREIPFTFGCMGTMALGLFGGCLAVGLSAAMLVFAKPESLRVAVVVVPLALLAVSGFVFYGAVRMARRLWRDTRRPSAVRMEGPVVRRVEGEGKDARYLAVLGDCTLPLLTKKAFDAFEDGKRYRVFLSFHLRRFLSVEPIDEAREAGPSAAPSERAGKATGKKARRDGG